MPSLVVSRNTGIHRASETGPRLRATDLEHLLELFPCASFLERRGTLYAMNAAARAMTGVPSEETTVATAQVFVGNFPFIDPEVQCETQGIGQRGVAETFQCVLLRRTERPTTVHGMLHSIGTEDGLCRLIIAMERQNVGDSAPAEGTFLGDLLDGAPEAMAVTHAGRILHVNHEFTRLFGHTLADAVGRDIDALLIPEDRVHEAERIYRLITTDGRASAETVRRHADGSDLDVSVLVGPARLGEHSYCLFHTYRDVRLQRAMQARLQHSATHDALTGLPNRMLLLDRLNGALARLQRNQSRSFAMLFLDLDGFKAVNDTMGHNGGDELLCAVADRIRDCVRPQDTVARFGGDEFAVLLDEVASEVQATHVAGRIQRAVQGVTLESPVMLRVTASIGVALISDGRQAADSVLHHADLAMYQAKSQGKNQYALFDKSMASGFALVAA